MPKCAFSVNCATVYAKHSVRYTNIAVVAEIQNEINVWTGA